MFAIPINMTLIPNYSLKNYNTFGIDTKAKWFASVTDTTVLKNLIETYKDKENLFFLGGGSNLLFTKDFFDALVIKVDLKGIEIKDETEDHVIIEVQSGEILHELVLWSIAHGYGGLENLSLIYGNVGTAPMQNVGAYGVEIKDIFISCTTLNIETLETEQFSNAECKFGYRESIFKNEAKNKHVILSVRFRLTKKNHILKTAYGDIQNELTKRNITVPTIKDISDAVIAIRSSKLPNPAKIGNSGSFFKNPIISKTAFDEFILRFPEAPYYSVSENEVKIPAGWLIEKAGYKGFRRGDAGVHQRQALVLVNYGNATGNELITLAYEIQSKVKEVFGIEISPEVNII